MRSNHSQEVPNLAPPGAGIPFPQKLLLRFIVRPLVAGREDPAKSRKRFERLHEKIRETYLQIPESKRELKVLVPSQRGLEDSSRYWSAAMVLEHLEIVGSGVGDLIISLSNGQVPGEKVDTALVKPPGVKSHDEALASFDRFRADLMPRLQDRIGNLNSPLRKVHQWFGPFTARQWYWLLGIHAGIHLQQLGAIRRSLA